MSFDSIKQAVAIIVNINHKYLSEEYQSFQENKVVMEPKDEDDDVRKDIHFLIDEKGRKVYYHGYTDEEFEMMQIEKNKWKRLIRDIPVIFGQVAGLISRDQFDAVLNSLEDGNLTNRDRDIDPISQKVFYNY
jgi:hypothetical protein